MWLARTVLPTARAWTQPKVALSPGSTAGGATTLEEDLVAALDRHLRPEGIVELVLVAAIVTAMHRYTASIRPDRLAPEVEAFVAEHGPLLGLPARS